MKLLLHVCCAPCSVYCIEQLRKENIEPVLYWYNPNIHPFKEYEKRKNTLIDYSESIGADLIIEDEYGLDLFCENVSDKINSRCIDYCYPVRLRKTFEYAKNNGFDAVSTTLLYSIYQNHSFIKSYAEKLSIEYGVKFFYRDFRVGFWEGHDKAIEAGLYMQKYCGCIYSEEDRYLKKSNTKPDLPEGFEFNKRTPLQIKKDKCDEGEKYSLVKGDITVCSAVFCEYNDEIIELKALYIDSEYLNKDFEKRLLNSVLGNFKHKYNKVIVFSVPEKIPFYIKLGFDEYAGTKSDNERIYGYIRKL